MAKEIIELYGFSLRKDTIYEIREKLDPDAPDGFLEYETSKILQDKIYDSEPGAIWNNSLGVWDTGVFEESPFLRQAFPEKTTREKALEQIRVNIVEPIERVKAGFFNNTAENDPFWNRYLIHIRRTGHFNTSNPEELYQLFILLLTKRITPKNISSHPEFKNSQYVVVDKEETMNKETEKVLREMRANELFAVNKSNKEHLVILLDYAGMNGITKDTADDTIVVMFKKFLDDKNQGVQNTINFINVAEMTKKKETDMLFIYGKLKELTRKGVMQHKTDGIYLDEQYLGNSYKVAAKEINETKDLKIKFNEALASVEL